MHLQKLCLKKINIAIAIFETAGEYRTGATNASAIFGSAGNSDAGELGEAIEGKQNHTHR